MRYFGLLFALGVWVAPLLAEQSTPHAPNGYQRDQRLVRQGEWGHARFVESMGGAYHDPAMLHFINAVAKQITDVSQQADERWEVTVLDTPAVNAFARPGGYLYITRGMLAILADEDELAAMLAHEVVHIAEAQFVAEREAAPDTSGGRIIGDLIASWLNPEAQSSDVFEAIEQEQVEFMAFSREQELAADTHGIGLLVAAGYDPTAMSDALAAMFDWAAMEDSWYGYYSDPLEQDEMSDYPADALRVAETRRLGYLALDGMVRPARRYRNYIKAITGLPFGAAVPNVIAEGQVLYIRNAGLRMTFPEGYTLRTGQQSTLILGPERMRLRMDVVADTGQSLRDYISHNWAPALREDLAGQQLVVHSIHESDLAGFEGAFANSEITSATQTKTELKFVVLRHNSFLVRIRVEQRFSGSDIVDDPVVWRDWFNSQFAHIAPLDRNAARRLNGLQLRFISVKPTDSVAQLMAAAQADYNALDVFARLNRLRPLALPEPGAIVVTLAR